MKTTLTFIALLITSTLVANSKPLQEKEKKSTATINLHGWSNPHGTDATSYVEATVTNANAGVPGCTVQFTLISGTGPAPSSGVSDSTGKVRKQVSWNTKIIAFTVLGGNSIVSSAWNTGPNPRQPKKD